MIRYFSVLVVLISVLLASCRSTPTPDLEATIQAGVAATQAAQPTNTLTPEPRDTPTPEPTDTPTAEPTDTPAPTSTARPTETPMPTDTSEPTQAPEPTEAPSSDYSLSVVGVEDPATPRPRHEPKEGTKALAVEVILGNVSGDTHRVNPLNGTLVDQDGFSYYPELAAREGGYIDGIDLAPGEKVRGWIPFEVPVGTVASYIKYQFSGYPDITLIASVDSESLKAPEPTPTKPPPPRTSTQSNCI